MNKNPRSFEFLYYINVCMFINNLVINIYVNLCILWHIVNDQHNSHLVLC